MGSWPVRAVLAWGLVLVAQAARSAEPAVPVEVQLPLLLKVLSFDRSLPRRAPRQIAIALLYQRLYPASVDCKEEVEAAVQRSGLRTISGIPFRLEPYDLDEGGLAGLERLEAAVAYVAPLRGLDVEAVGRVTRARGWLSLSGLPEYVEQGLAVGIDRRGDRPLILVNLEAARAEGADLSSRLLGLRVVKVVGP